MTKVGGTKSVVVFLAAVLCAGVGAAQVFGTKDYTISRISATSFVPADSGQASHTSGSLGRFGSINTESHFYATLDLPAGIVIDYIGLNNLNDGTPNAMSVNLWFRGASGTAGAVASLLSTAHTSWQTDINSVPFNLQVIGHSSVRILDVGIAASPNLQFFGWVEVWWRHVVSPGGLAHFSDVPPTHPLFQFVEALYAAGITAGYSDGRYGVNDPITRGQMAVYLSTALGLHWPF
jgi:S-layer homology domain